MMAVLVAAFLVLSLSVGSVLAGTDILRPDASVAADCVTVTAGDQTLKISLTNADLDLNTPYQNYRFSPSLMHGEGWVRPATPASKPKIEKRRGGIHVEIRYPVAGDRAFTIEADAYDGIPAVFLTSRLEVTRSTRAEYYFWGWRGTFGHYYAATQSGFERVEVDTSRSIRLGYRDWFFLPSESGGLALMSKGDIGRAAGENGEPYLWAIIRGRALGVGESMVAGFGVAGVKDQHEAERLWNLVRKHSIPALQRTPDLKRLSGVDYGRPAPEWLRNAEVYNGFYRSRYAWNRTNISGLLSRVPLIVGVPHDKLIISMCHRAGFRVIPYVNYMELLNTEVEKDARGKVYYEWTQQVDNERLDLLKHPDWIAYDSEGHQIKSIWGSNNGHPGLFYTCFHQPGLREAALEQVRKLMQMGADGVFIDNAGPVTECEGDKSGKHRHTDASKTNTQMYEQLQREIYDVVKSFGEDRIVMQNTGVIASHWPYCDAQMWESCIYGAGTKDRLHEWEELRYCGEELAEAARHGKIPVILSYLDSQPAEHRGDRAVYSYAYSRLYDILWADWFTSIQPNLPANEAIGLYSVRLGKAKGGARQMGNVFVREFEHGMVLLNPSMRAEQVTVPAPRGARVDDIGRGVILTPAKGVFRVEVGPESGRVMCW